MIGDIHQCVINIKSGRSSKVLLRAGDQYKVLKASSIEGARALDPLFCDTDNLIGVFTPSVATAAIYEEASEAMRHTAQGEAA